MQIEVFIMLSEFFSQTNFFYSVSDGLNSIIIVLIAGLSACLFLLLFSYLDLKLRKEND